MPVQTFSIKTFSADISGVAEWDGTNHEDLADWLSDNDSFVSPWTVESATETTLTLHRGFNTPPEAVLTMQVGDWIEPSQPTVYGAGARAGLAKLGTGNKYEKLSDLLPQGSNCPMCQRPLP